MTFTPVPGERYDMPVPFGPSIAPPVSEGFQTYTTTVTFATTQDAVGALLPKWFEPADRQLLTVSYVRMVGMEWMGGRNYNIVAVGANVVCVAGEEPFDGRYTLAIWESDAAPTIAGREYMGSPKLLAGIPDVDVFADEYSFACSEYDSPLITARVRGLRELTSEELAPMIEAGREVEGLNWKYIPGLDGEPDVNYPTALYMAHQYDRGARGEGSVEFGTPTDQQAPYSAKIVRVLGQMPLLEHVDTLVLHSAYSHLFRDRTRRLDVGTRAGAMAGSAQGRSS